MNGVLFYELLQPDEIVIVECYNQLNNLIDEIEHKKQFIERGNRGNVILLHDNIRRHTQQTIFEKVNCTSLIGLFNTKFSNWLV